MNLHPGLGIEFRLILKHFFCHEYQWSLITNAFFYLVAYLLVYLFPSLIYSFFFLSRYLCVYVYLLSRQQRPWLKAILWKREKHKTYKWIWLNSLRNVHALLAWDDCSKSDSWPLEAKVVEGLTRCILFIIYLRFQDIFCLTEKVEKK